MVAKQLGNLKPMIQDETKTDLYGTMTYVYLMMVDAVSDEIKESEVFKLRALQIE